MGTRRNLFCALALCLAGVTLYSANINNLLYTAADQAHRATLSYATRLLTRIESCPGYTGEEEVLIIGSFPTDRIYADIESYALVDHYSVPRDTVAPSTSISTTTSTTGSTCPLRSRRRRP